MTSGEVADERAEAALDFWVRCRIVNPTRARLHA